MSGKMRLVIELPDEALPTAAECVKWLGEHHFMSCGAFMTVQCPGDGAPRLAWRVLGAEIEEGKGDDEKTR